MLVLNHTLELLKISENLWSNVVTLAWREANYNTDKDVIFDLDSNIWSVHVFLLDVKRDIGGVLTCQQQLVGSLETNLENSLHIVKEYEPDANDVD